MEISVQNYFTEFLELLHVFYYGGLLIYLIACPIIMVMKIEILQMHRWGNSLRCYNIIISSRAHTFFRKRVQREL
jgi:hypothetical protein